MSGLKTPSAYSVWWFRKLKNEDTVIQKIPFRIATIALCAFSLVACGGKGLDRKLDYSGTEKELGESLGEALAGATPDQQNIVRSRAQEILSIGLFLARNSNPAIVEANLAKKNADEFELVKKMSVKELLLWNLKKQETQLNKIIPITEKFRNGELLKIDNMEMMEADPKEFMEPPSRFKIKGVMTVRNDSDNFDYDFRGCEMYLAIDGQRVDKKGGSGQCQLKFMVVDSKGGKQRVNFEYTIYGKEDVQNFADFLKNPGTKKSTWNFDSSQDSYLRLSSDKNEIYSLKDLEGDKKRLAAISADLLVLSK
jgi:hypothetical protein